MKHLFKVPLRMGELESSRKSQAFYDTCLEIAKYYNSKLIVESKWDFTFREYMEDPYEHFRESANKPMVFTSI